MKQFFLILRFFLLLIVLIGTINANNTPYSYSYIPKFVYKNQVFPVTIFVKHYDKKNYPRFDFDLIGQTQPLDIKPNLLINKNSAYYTYYFKAPDNENELTIPQLSIWNLDYTYILNPKIIKIKELNVTNIKNFSNVLASTFRINSVKVNSYDSNNSLVTLNIEATEANLEDIKIPNVLDDGIEKIKRDGSKVTASYYFVIPSSTKKIDFSYYNLIKKRFETKNISTIKQTRNSENIAPKDLSFDKIKLYTLLGLILFFVILIIFTKDILYIVIAIILTIFTIYNYFSHSNICIKEGASIYILPTYKSNVITQIPSKLNTSSIKEYNGYHKIEYKDLIGWIKNEDLCKN